jgi:hypothetical protein
MCGLTVVACSGVTGERDRDGRLSKSEFVAKANDICADSKAQIAQIAAPSLADPVAVETAVAQAVAIHRRALRELRELDPPERDEPGIKAWLQEVNGAVEQMEAVRQGLADGDSEAIAEASEKGDAFTTDAEAFADAYGVNECSTTEEDDQ